MINGRRSLFADGGRSAWASGEQQSAAWGGGELPISHGDIELFLTLKIGW